jgi:hypothetical protein
MKKLILGALMLLGFAGFSNAQVAPAKPPVKAKTVKPTVPAVKQPATTAVVVKPTVKSKDVVAPAKATNAQGVVLKSDGTPDKRFKVGTPAAKGPVKKDGTPDLRYKENKKLKS